MFETIIQHARDAAEWAADSAETAAEGDCLEIGDFESRNALECAEQALEAAKEPREDA